MSARRPRNRSSSASSFSATATLFVPVRIEHPLWMIAFLVLTSVAFSLFGFIIGIWAKTFEQLAIIPALVVTPLTFLGGAFYSIDMLPPFWRTASLFNPVVYLVSGFRWSFYGRGDVGVAVSLGIHVAVHRRLPCRPRLDLPDGMAAEAVSHGPHPASGREGTTTTALSRKGRPRFGRTRQVPPTSATRASSRAARFCRSPCFPAARSSAGADEPASS